MHRKDIKMFYNLLIFSNMYFWSKSLVWVTFIMLFCYQILFFCQKKIRRIFVCMKIVKIEIIKIKNISFDNEISYFVQLKEG